MEGCQGHACLASTLSAWHEHFPGQNHMSCPSVALMMSIYLSLPLHQCHCVKDNGCFSASARCFLALICCHRLCPMHSGISFTCSVFLCADLQTVFYQFVKSDIHFVSVLFSVVLQVHIVYLGHNNGLTPSLTTRFHLQLLSRVFAE